MKRLVPLAISLLLILSLVACGEGVEESVTPRPTPTQVTLPRLNYIRAAEQPDYIPPMDFAPVSVWQAKPFGNGGRALLYMGAEENGEIPFKVFSSFYYELSPLQELPLLSARSFSGKIRPDSRFDISCELTDCRLSPVHGLSELYGRADLSDETVRFSYVGYELAPWSAQTLTVDLDACQPVIDSGDSTLDSVQYLPVEFFRLPDESLGSAMYYMPVFEEELLNTQNPRGLQVGDTYANLEGRLPNPFNYRDPKSVVAPSGWYQCLYGDEASTFRALISYNIEPEYVSVSAHSWAVFYLDEDLNITNIEITEW